VTDLGVGFDKFPAELLEIAELRYLSFSLAGRRWSRQRLREGFAVRLIGKPEIRAVARLAGSMAAAVWLATATRSVGNGTSSKITKFRDSPSDGIPTLL
jgi:hypothetical protein